VSTQKKSAVEEDKMKERKKLIKMARNINKKKEEKKEGRKNIHLNRSNTTFVYQKLKSFDLCSKKWSVEKRKF
jgi:uncharacterized membrane protein